MSVARPLPPLNGLRAFEAAGRHLAFSAAAEELGVTQGAVAQQVRGLEAHLGLRLFLRHPRGLALTDEGRPYHAAVSRAFGLLAEASANLRPSPTRVTISVTPTFASKWLIPRLPEFTRANPATDLRIMATERVVSFHGDGADLAVRFGKPPFGASLRADLLFRNEVVAVCAPALVPGGRPIAADALARLPLLHDTHDLWPAFLEAAIGEFPRRPVHGTRFSQISLALDAALAGQGVALASRFLVARDLSAGRLVQPIETRLTGDGDFHLLMPRRTRSPAVEAARNWLLETAASET